VILETRRALFPGLEAFPEEKERLKLKKEILQVTRIARQLP
jgi:hypothetical protein